MPSSPFNGVQISSVQPAFPDLNPEALQSLTQKIEQSFRKDESSISRVSPKTGAEGKRKTKNKKRAAEDTLTERKPQSGKFNTEIAVKGNRANGQKPAQAQEQDQGKKRLRNGELKSFQASPPRHVSGKHNAKGKTRKKELKVPETFGFRDEIRALGGTDDDYALIKDIQSDSEVEGPSKKKNEVDLEKDLKQFVSGLGISNVRDDASTDTSDDDETGGEFDGADDPTRNNFTASNGIPEGSNKTKADATTSKYRSKDQGNLLLEPRSEWHAAELLTLPKPNDGQKAVPLDLIERLHAHAKVLLEKENQAYVDTSRSASSDQRYRSTIMSTGTLSDKIGALTLSAQESPLHNTKALEGLIGLARKRSRAQAVEVLGALKDLFGPGNLLPSDRKLLPFAGQPGLHAMFSANPQWTQEKPLPQPLNESHLIFWAYEDWLKSVFFQTLQILETWCNDEIVFARGRAVDYVFTLLKDKPEQEANLLRLLVNKLGDTDKKVASKSSYHIMQLETAHPAMKPTIISAIESDLLFRPNQSLHAQYYATITLNQTVLSNREEPLAKKLIGIYFKMFLKLLNKPKKIDEVAEDEIRNRAVTLNSKGEVQGGGSAKGKSALKKQASMTKSTAADEELREKMVAAVLTGVNRAIPYTSTNDESFEKHLDTLFRVTHSSNFNTSIQALMLIQQIQGSNQNTVDRFYRTLYESLLDPRLLTSSKQVLYLNLLYRALRSDLNVDRIKAFSKRILQVVAMHQPPFTCGAIYLVRELEGVFPSLQAFVDQPEDDPSDDEETFRDVPEDLTSISSSTNKPRKSTTSTLYDPRKRDPLHSNASASTLWDIQPLTQHYHPSVSLFATRLLTHAPMPPKPDLSLNTLIHFLDRFVYKNPKASVTKRTTMKGSSLMQPLAGGDKSATLVSRANSGGEVPVNSDAFWKKAVENVGADEVFFHRYFSEVGKRKERRFEKKERKQRDKEGIEVDSNEGGSDEDEEEILKVLVGSRPEVAGDDEGFDEEELEGYDDDEEDMEDTEEDGDIVESDGDDGFPSFSDDEDDALVDSDVELPNGLGLENAFGTEAKLADDGMKTNKASGKNEERKERKRRLKNLPTFASVDEYQKLLGGDEDEGVA